MDIKRVQEIDNNSKHDVYIFLEEKGMREYKNTWYENLDKMAKLMIPNKEMWINKFMSYMKKPESVHAPYKSKVKIKLIKNA